MEIRFRNVTFIYERAPEKSVGSFRAYYPTDTFFKVANFYDTFGYYLIEKNYKKLINDVFVDSVDINELIMYLHYCFHIESDKEHEISVRSSSPFFIIHDAFHALYDIKLYDNVEGCEPFYRLSCQSECEANQLVAALKFMLDNDLDINDEYLKKVEKIYYNQTKTSLDLILEKNTFLEKRKKYIVNGVVYYDLDKVPIEQIINSDSITTIEYLTKEQIEERFNIEV